MLHVVRYETQGDRARLIAKYGERVINEIPEFSILHVDGCTCHELGVEEGVCAVAEDVLMEQAAPDPNFEYPIRDEPMSEDGRTLIAVVDKDDGHGSRVGQIARSKGNPVRLYPNQGNIFTTLDATRQAMIDGCKVINLSLIGGTPFWIGVFKYLENLHEAGFDVPLIVTAAGGNVSYNEAYIEPAAFVSPFNLTVGCCDSNGRLRGGTAWGDEVEVFATETAPSWAAPHVSALAARLRDLGLSAQESRDAIIGNVSKKNLLADKCSSGGIVDWDATIKSLSKPVPVPDEEEPEPIPEPEPEPEPESPPEEDPMPEYIKTITTPNYTIHVDQDYSKRNEGLDKLVDGHGGTKWLGHAPTTNFLVEAKDGFVSDRIRLVSANDFSGRDPSKITFKTESDEFSVEIPEFNGRFEEIEIELPGLLFGTWTMVMKNRGEPLTQLAEMEFLPVEEVDLSYEAFVEWVMKLEERIEILESKIVQ